MQFEALKVFCDVVRHRSFSLAAAAQSPPVSQSAVSQVVLMLEHRIGVQLIDRSTRPLLLTELGQVYFEGCLKLVEQYQELEASIRQAQAKLDATVQVAAIYSIGLGDMGQYVKQFEAQYPGIKVHIEFLHPDRVYERVLARTADFGLVSFPRRMRELAIMPWRDEPMILACAPTHPLARHRTVRAAQLQGENFVSFDRELVIRREIDRFLREQGVTVNVVMEFDNIENIKKAIEIAAGVALLPEPTLRREVAAGTLVAVPLAGCPLVRPLGIVHSRHLKLNTTILRFIDLLRDHESPANSRPAGGEGASRRRPRGTHRNGQSRRTRVSRASQGTL